jgi:hypothetical protein
MNKHEADDYDMALFHVLVHVLQCLVFHILCFKASFKVVSMTLL